MLEKREPQDHVPLKQGLSPHPPPCLASTTQRLVTEPEPNKKNVEFRFVRFRRYQ